MAQKKKNKNQKNAETERKNILKNPIVKIGAKTFSLLQIVLISVVLIFAAFFIYNNFSRNNKSVVEYYTFKKEGELTFTDSLGKSKSKIDLEIADNDYERQLGLMNRKSMEENQGMLFIFPLETYQSFWMRNTLISLDMIFVNKDHKIVTIHKNTKLLSTQSYPSSEPALYVLEVLGGYTDRHNIIIGDKIYWMSNKLGFNNSE